MTIEIRMLGALRLTTTDGRDLGSLLRQPKRVALLAYLAAAVPRGLHRRDTLLAHFWPELDDSHARAALNQALYVLRGALGEESIVARGDTEIGLHTVAVWSDVGAFEAALEEGRPTDALALYGGDLLEGFFVPGAEGFERWLESARARLHQRASDGAWRVADAKALEGDAVDAARWARRAAEFFPTDEGVARRLVSFLDRVGDRAAALRAYEAFAWHLKRELDVEPSAETQALALSLREEGQRPARVRRIHRTGRPVRTILVTVRQRLGTRPLAALAIGVLALGLAAAAWIGRSPLPTSHPVFVATLDLGDDSIMTRGITGSTIALSPDGSRLVYVGRTGSTRRLLRRTLDRLGIDSVPGTEDAYLPFFSSDGQWLAFVQGERILKMPVAGGPAITVCTVAQSVQGASWGTNDTIVFATPAGLWRVAAGGGEARMIVAADTATRTWYRWPELLPGGRAAVVTQVDSTGFQLVIVSVETGAIRLLDLQGTSARFVAPGDLVFARPGGTLLAVPFDPRSARVVGAAVPVTQDISVGTHGAAKFGTSRFGAIAYASEDIGGRALVLVDHAGHEESLPIPRAAYRAVRVSPDGRRILTSLAADAADKTDLWLFDLDRGTSSALTFGDRGRYPDWMPDGERIVLSSTDGGRAAGYEVRSLAADGSDSGTTIRPAEADQIPWDITPDGLQLVTNRVTPRSRRDLWIVPLEKAAEPIPYLRTNADEDAAAVSPDGRWLAYVSDETGRDEVYVRSFPRPGAAIRISEAGGKEPRWAPGGRELFYRTGTGMLAAEVTRTPSMRVVRRRRLFDDAPYVAALNGAIYDVHPDGRRFAMIRRGTERADIVIAEHWFEGPRLPIASAARPR